MSGETLTDAQRERAELIEQALLMNLILSLPAKVEGHVESAPAHGPAPPSARNERRPPDSRD